jgi:hypothetical protein
MNAGDAAAKVIGGIEERSIAVRDFNAQSQQISGDWFAVTTLEEFNGATSPDGPVSEQTTGEPPVMARAAKRSDKVGDNGIIVTGVQGNIGATAFSEALDDVECLIAIKRRHFDGDNPFNFKETPPKNRESNRPPTAGWR